MSDLDVAGYLDRLAVRRPARPSVAALRALHRAHVERVAYTTMDIHLGRATTVDPLESADRIVRLGRGGYCYHLNGGFSALLAALGFDVRLHVGGVQPHGLAAPVGATGNHLALTVHGLPDGPWLVDVGLGDALHEPVPLRAGGFRQGPFGYALGRSAAVPGGWRLDHDPTGGFVGMDFDPGPVGPDAFAAMHAGLSTSPTSGFVRVLTAQRRHAAGADILRGCVLRLVRAGGPTSRELSTMDEWLAELTGTFGLGLADVPPADRALLWERVRASHRAWVAAGRP